MGHLFASDVDALGGKCFESIMPLCASVPAASCCGIWNNPTAIC